jgi:hypothetical protein
MRITQVYRPLVVAMWRTNQSVVTKKRRGNEKSAMIARDQEEQLKRLENDPDFQALERELGGFNILEVLGVVRHELRHSDFLAFLLDPSGKHGMGDFFLKRFQRSGIT